MSCPHFHLERGKRKEERGKKKEERGKKKEERRKKKEERAKSQKFKIHEKLQWAVAVSRDIILKVLD